MTSLQKTSILVCATILILFGTVGVVVFWPTLSHYLTTSSVFPAEEQTGVDPFSYDPPLPSLVKDLNASYTIQAELHPSEARIKGELTLAFDNPQTTDLRLYIYDYNWNKMSIKSIRYQDQSLPFERKLSMVTLDNPFQGMERGELAIEFEHPVPRRGTRYGVKDDIWILTTWYPMLGAMNQQGEWYDPPLRIHFGDPFVYHYADYDVSFVSPKGYKWVSSWGLGEQRELDGSKQEIHYEGKKLLNFALVGSPLYQIETITIEPGLQVDIASVDKQNIERIKVIAEEAFPAFAEWYGNLPYPHVAIAETSPGTTYAMEYANMAIFKRDMHASSLIDHWLPHEIAHLWWYNSVATLEATHGWVDEGIVELSVVHYLDARYGSQSAESLLASYRKDVDMLRQKYPNGSLSKTLHDFRTEEEFHWTWYSKGALLFDELRREIGDEAYKRFLKRVQQNYHAHVIGAEHLDQALGQALRGKARYFVPNVQVNNQAALQPLSLEPYVTTILNDMSFYPSLPARMLQDTVYVPLREVGEKLGARISWDESNDQILVSANSRDVRISADSQAVTVDGEEVVLEKPIVEIEERTMVPLAFFQDVLGYTVTANLELREVRISR
ncbi:stalk domain-containing protein [Brevibacillus sp. TJ4]|uniref:stalk domain-containing protein n=1 Tax=Brevibacillus sp. TJ4 TaxID=3234853 RepID=UPI0037D1AC77